MQHLKNYETIKKAILNLSIQDQLSLLESLVQELKRTNLKENSKEENELTWESLYGIGKGVWTEDAQEYINKQREDRF